MRNSRVSRANLKGIPQQILKNHLNLPSKYPWGEINGSSCVLNVIKDFVKTIFYGHGKIIFYPWEFLAIEAGNLLGNSRGFQVFSIW